MPTSASLKEDDPYDRWSVIPDATKNPNALKKWLNHVLWRDFKVERYDILSLLFETIIFTSQLGFLISALNTKLPFYSFNSIEKIIIYAITALTIIFGGIAADLFIRRRNLYQIFTLIGIITIVILLYVPLNAIGFVAAIILALVSAFLGLIFFVSILSRTNLLNRGRTTALITFLLIVSASPFIVLINMYEIAFNFAWLPSLIFGILLIFSNKKTTKEQRTGQVQKIEVLSLKNLYQLLRETSTITYFIFLFLTAATLGFYVANTFGYINSTWQIIIAGVVGLISFPIIGSTLDNTGRKPLIYLTFLMVGTFSIFFDYPGTFMISETNRKSPNH
jgi:hypothetical protein